MSTASSCGKNQGDTFNLELAGTAVTQVTPTGRVDATGGAAFNLDDWTKFLHNYGIPYTGTNASGDRALGAGLGRPPSPSTCSMPSRTPRPARCCTPRPRSVAGATSRRRSESQIVAAINAAFNDIFSVATSFASVTLPLSAENRALSKNQVFIGMFRPSLGKKPRWYGNLRQYQLALDNGDPVLADARRTRAINPLSGFLRECAVSFWTTDTGAYWENLGRQPAAPRAV